MSLEELLQAAVDAREMTDEAQWRLGAICTLLCGKMQVTKGKAAEVLGCSTQRVTSLIRTWETFPAEHDRVPELTWKHHEIASKTEKPHEAIALAADNQWSIRELSAAVKTVKPEEEAAMEKAKRARNLVRTVLDHNNTASRWLEAQLRELMGVETC